MAKKNVSRPRGSSDPALSAFKALQHVIEQTEGPKPRNLRLQNPITAVQ
jgi:chaperonin GroEL (HSP60 family)